MKMKILALLLFIGMVSSATVLVTLNESNYGNFGDTYVSQPAPTTNYGTSTVMTADDNLANFKWIYTLWNTSLYPYALPSSVTVSINDVRLSLYMILAPTSTMNLRAYNTSWSNWTETTPTWGIKSVGNTVQDTVASGTANGVWKNWNVTNAFKASYGSSKNMSIMVNMTTADIYFANFTTKENATAAYRPQLNVTYTITTSPTYPQAGLVGYWRFDENTGNYTVDSSGNENLGTLVSSPTWTTGNNYQTPYALSYDGEYVDVGNASVLNFNASGAFTISFWAKFGDLTSGNIMVLLSKWYSTAINRSYAILQDTDNKIYMNTRTPEGATIATYSDSAITSTANWYHIAAVWDGTHTYLYINGVQQADVDTLTAMNASITPVHFGVLYPNLNSWVGTIDEVKIWNRSLSASEIMNETFHYCPMNPINITTYNESSTSQSVGFNLVASNTTSTFSYSNNFTDYYCNSSFPTGSATISISNSSFYSPRYYYSTLAYGGSYSLDAYLLPLDDLYAISTTILVSNGAGGVVPGAWVTIYKSIEAVNTIISQDTADGVGQTRFNLDAQTSYLLVANMTGYTQFSMSFQPSQPVYTITLTTTNATSPLFNCSSCGVSWNMTPTGFLVTGIQNFNFSIADYYNDLDFWGMDVTYNGTSQYFTNQTTASGGSVNYTMNTSEVLGNGVNVTIFFYRNGTFFDPTYQYGTYSFIAGNASLVSAMAAVGVSELSSLTKGILAAVFITCFAGYVGATMSLGGGVVIEILGLWFFASIGYMQYLALVQLTILGLALVYNRYVALTPMG